MEGPYLGGGGIVEFLGEVVKGFKKERRGKKIFGFLNFGEDEGIVFTGLYWRIREGDFFFLAHFFFFSF